MSVEIDFAVKCPVHGVQEVGDALVEECLHADEWRCPICGEPADEVGIETEKKITWRKALEEGR